MDMNFTQGTLNWPTSNIFSAYCHDKKRKQEKLVFSYYFRKRCLLMGYAVYF